MFKAILAVVAGVGLLVAATIGIHAKQDFLRTSSLVPGRVVQLNFGGSHPQIEFVTTAGERVTYPQGGWIFNMKVGEAVEVRYQPAAPISTATVNRFGAVWANTMLCGGLGGALLLGGMLRVRSQTRRYEGMTDLPFEG